MATVREWADAYLAQARADLEGAWALGGTAPSVFAMLLQMVFEKLAKAALLRSGAVTVAWAQGTHAAASRMVMVMLRERGRIAPLGGPQAWQHVLSVVARLENAHPQVAARLGPGSPARVPVGGSRWRDSVARTGSRGCRVARDSAEQPRSTRPTICFAAG